MPARVITVTSGKGGVGKTTTTANVSIALALLGKRVACMDADIGLRNLDVVLGLENRIIYDVVDVIEGRCRLRQALIKDKRLSELYLLPASQKRDKSAVRPEDLIKICNELKPEFDFILIDSAAGIEEGFRTAVAPADEVVIVTNPEVSAVRDADRVVGLIEAAEKGPARLIVNRLKPESGPARRHAGHQRCAGHSRHRSDRHCAGRRRGVDLHQSRQPGRVRR